MSHFPLTLQVYLLKFCMEADTLIENRKSGEIPCSDESWSEVEATAVVWVAWRRVASVIVWSVIIAWYCMWLSLCLSKYAASRSKPSRYPIGVNLTVFLHLSCIVLIKWRSCVPCVTVGLGPITPDDDYTSPWTSFEDEHDCDTDSELGN